MSRLRHASVTRDDFLRELSFVPRLTSKSHSHGDADVNHLQALDRLHSQKLERVRLLSSSTKSSRREIHKVILRYIYFTAVDARLQFSSLISWRGFSDCVVKRNINIIMLK